MSRLDHAQQLQAGDSAAVCIAIPGRILEIYSEQDTLVGTVQFSDVTSCVCLDLVADAKIGDYVLVYTGFARAVLDEQEAEILIQLNAEMAQLLDPEGEDAARSPEVAEEGRAVPVLADRSVTPLEEVQE